MEQAGHRGSRARLLITALVAVLGLVVVVPVAAGQEPPAPAPLPIELASIGALEGPTPAAATATKRAIRIGTPKGTTTAASTTSTTASTSTTTSTASPTSTSTTVVGTGTMLFPMAPLPKCYVLDSFGDYRSGRSHQGVDILASLGQEVYAVADGTLTKQYLDAVEPLAGNGWKQTLPDGTTYAYLHLSGFAAGLVEGSVVRRGDLIGYVGDTGNPGPGNYHLHFEYHPRGGAAVDPLPLLAIPDSCTVY